MSPQFVDFSGDGRVDMVMGTFEGVPFLVPGTADGFGPFERIQDARGRDVVLAQFWNNATETWDEADRSPAGARNPKDHGISAVAFDWDADGDLDLLLGAKEGRLYLRSNEGKPGAAAFAGENQRIAGIEVPGGLTTPRLVDWDADGHVDLVCGSFNGGVYLVRNAGAAGAPRFAEPVELIAPGSSSASWRDALPEGPRRPMAGAYPEAVDYDGDGDLDLLVGGEASWKRKGRALDDAERARVDELKHRLRSLERKLYELYDYEPDDAPSAVRHAKVLAGMDRYIAATAEQLDELEPQEQSRYYVWLYRRVGAPARLDVDVDPPTPDAPVQAGMATSVGSATSVAVGETFTLAVRIRVAPGWHVYDAGAGERLVGTTLLLKLPDGLVADAGWEQPPSEPGAEPGLRVWQGDLVFRRRVRVERLPAADASIDCTLAFQACDETKCLPPQKRLLSVAWRSSP
jgi:hypothetical protein